MYKYKIVASYKGGSYEEIDIAKTREDVKYLVSEYKMAYGNDWKIIYYNIED